MFIKIDIDGRRLTFEPIVRPVIALQGGMARGVAIDRALKSDDEPRPAGAAVARLSEYDAHDLDRALAGAGLAAVNEVQARDKALFAPVTFASLATPARCEIPPRLVTAQNRLAAHLVLEVTTPDPGLPPSRLVEVLTAVRPVCGMIFARLRPERWAIEALSNFGLAGASIEASDQADPQDHKALTRIRLDLRAVGLRMLIHNLRTERHQRRSQGGRELWQFGHRGIGRARLSGPS